MTKPRILIIENSIDVTGALKSINQTAHDLKQYFDFQFLIPKKAKNRFWIEGKGIKTIHELPLKEISRRLSSLIVYLPYLLINTLRLRRIVARENISIIHVNDLYNLLPVTLRLLGSKVSYVCHIRFLPNKFPSLLFNFWLKLHFRYASKVVVVSQSVLSMLPQHSKLVVIYDELPLEERHPSLTEPNQEKSHFSFLYLSNFIQGKGQNYALEAFVEIYRDLPKWKLRFVGGDMGMKKNRDYTKALQRRAKKLGIFEKTEWIGFTEDVELEYKQADVVLNFSESESFSITCLEALFYGRPVITTDCGGPIEIIDDNKTGLVVPNKNILRMTDAMNLLASNSQLRLEMGRAAREIVRSKFSIDKTSYRLMQQYDSILRV